MMRKQPNEAGKTHPAGRYCTWSDGRTLAEFANASVRSLACLGERSCRCPSSCGAADGA